MTNQEPIISNYINPCSASVSTKDSAISAFWVMTQKGIQYLPVKDGKNIVGLLPVRRVRAALTVSSKGTPKITDLMIRHPKVCAPDTSLFNVLDETPENAAGCTVIQNKSGEISGVFTPSDAVSAFQSLIHKRRPQACA